MILSKEHELVKKAISDFCQREIYDTDISAKMDQEGMDMPQELIDKMVKYKFLSPVIPKEYGGAGADYVSYAIIMEELSRADASCGTYLTAGASLVALPLVNFGTEEQKQKLDAAAGKIRGLIGNAGF